MMKVQLVLTLCSLSQAAYVSRMATMNRIRSPTAFRPGVTLQRPWTHPRLVQAASHRAPYVLYRSPPNRYAVKHYASNNRNVFTNGPWKITARVPALSPVTPDYEFVRAASAPPLLHSDGGTGAIHTIPAPNLSLSEKPIVVIDASDNIQPNGNAAPDQPKPAYEVTEKYSEPAYQMTKIEAPIGFSKAASFSTPEFQALVRNGGAALQLSSDYGLSALHLPQSSNVPQQYQMQGGFNGVPTHQEYLNSGAGGIVIPPNALYQPDPMFLHKLQNQLMQRFPAVEFIPYTAEVPPQIQVQNHQLSQPQNQLFLLENEEISKHPPESFMPSESKIIAQRQTQEGSLVTLIPQGFVANNISVDQEESRGPPQQRNITLELIEAESQPVTTTIKYIAESNTEEQNTTPIYYAQVGQSVGNVIANGFYSAINDVRAAAALEQVEKQQETTKAPIENDTTTVINFDFKPYLVQNNYSENAAAELKPSLGLPFAKTANSEPSPGTPFAKAGNLELSLGAPFTKAANSEPSPDAPFPKAANSEQSPGVPFDKAPNSEPSLGAPFEKTANSVKVAYTLMRADDIKPKMTQEGTVYAGQIIEASISEDNAFNKEQATLMRRAPLRLFAVTDKKDISSGATSSMPKITIVKAKIPPKSKLTFDDKTGEPVLRIYASYVDNPIQKEVITTKLANMKQTKESVTRKDTIENWKAATVKSVEKTQGFDANQVTQYGLKLRARSDDYIPLFEEYDD